MMKSALLLTVFILALGLPVGWLVSEFQPRRWLRIVLGLAALSTSLFISYVFSGLDQMGYNSRYGASSEKLVEVMIASLQTDQSEDLLPALQRLHRTYEPTYEENWTDYNELVAQFVNDVKSNHSADECW
jgi:hypothetical protein